MKRNYLFFVVLIAASAHAQTITALDVPANDLVYSNYSNRIYATVSTAASTNANSLAKLDPATALFEDYYPMSNNPGVMAISSNGEVIYVGKKGASTVQSFSVLTHTAGTEFSLGSEPTSGSYYADDIEVMPGQPNTIAVSRRNQNFAPRHEGVAMFDNGVIRATSTADHTGSNQIEFTDASNIVGFNNETTEYKFKKLSVAATGVTQTSNVNASTLPAAIGGPHTFSIYGNLAFFSNGRVVDFGATPTLLGTFADTFGPMVYTSEGMVCYASYDMGGNISLKAFNPTTQELIASLPIPQASGAVKNIVSCGPNCYAFNTADKIVVVTNALGVQSPVSDVVAIYPNPVHELLHFNLLTAAKQIAIYNQLGQVVLQTQELSADNTLDVSALSTGSYFVRIDFESGATTRKLIKL